MAAKMRCKTSEELIQVLEYLLHHRKEFIMAQVQLSITFNVASAPQPLTVTPSTLTQSLTVGVAVSSSAVAVVSGGTPPYTYALDANSGPMPTGVTFNEDGNGNIFLAGTPTVAGASTSPVLLDITDSAGTQIQVSSNMKAIK